MAYSRVIRIGNGSTNQFVLDFALGYLSEDEITCRVGDEVDGSGDPIYRDLTFLSDTLVEVSGAVPGNGVQIVFDRTVEKEDTVVHFSDGDVLDEFNLDISFKQILMSVHEVLDGRFGTFDQDIDMGAFQIKSLGEPTEDDDAVTKSYVDGIMPGNAALVIAAEDARDASQSSASSAAGSATAASSSASAAATSQSSAAGSATAASSSATSASNSASAASTSETNAATSASNAATSASTAQSSASSASTYASSAGSSATSASSDAASASTSATTASNAATEASDAWTSFNELYLGDKSSDPTLDNDGDTLQVGALYWNTVTAVLRVYNGAQWVDASAQVSRNSYVYTGTQDQTVFSGSDRNGNTLATGNKFINVYLNGIRLTETDDYTYTSTDLTMASGVNSGDEVLIEAVSTFELDDTVKITAQTLTTNEITQVRENLDLDTEIDFGSSFKLASDIGNGNKGLSFASSKFIDLNGSDIRLVNNSIIGLSMDDAGIVLTPKTPAFMAYNNAVSSQTSNGIPSMGNVAVNTGSCYDGPTNRFTAPVTGTYHFHAFLFFGLPNANAVGHFYFQVNGASTGAPHHTPNASAGALGHITVGGSMIRTLAQGDYVNLTALFSNGANLYAGVYSAWTGFLVG